jgi:predicted transposase/invertase (TIGR01784 family)
MKTDALFYELFKLDPRSLFELLSLNMEGDYVFERITVKTTEKRFDGFLKRADGQGSNVFIEIQGYDDPGIYWRLFREICTWYEQSDNDMSFIAIALFINENHIPKKCPFIDIALPNRFLQFSLSDCLKAIENKSGILTVLKPLILKNKRQLPELLPQWKSEIESLKLPANKTTLLEELLEYSILQRFPKLTLMEVQQMIQLTPLEKSAAVQQLIRLNVNISKKEAKKEGIRQGELIGEIRTLQRILKYPQSSQAELAEKPLKELRALLKKLKAGTEY